MKPLHESLRGVFEPRMDGIDLDDLSNEQRVARAEQVRSLIRHGGWKIMNELVFILTSSLKDSISTTKLENVHYIQGQINGLEAWQNAASIILDEGDVAKEEIEKDGDEEEAQIPREGPPPR